MLQLKKEPRVTPLPTKSIHTVAIGRVPTNESPVYLTLYILHISARKEARGSPNPYVMGVSLHSPLRVIGDNYSKGYFAKMSPGRRSSDKRPQTNA